VRLVSTAQNADAAYMDPGVVGRASPRPAGVAGGVALGVVLALSGCTASTHSAPRAILLGTARVIGGPAGNPAEPNPNRPIRILDNSGAVVATTSTDADGRYRINLRPGSYGVSLDCFGSWHYPLGVTLAASSTDRVDLRCDIR